MMLYKIYYIDLDNDIKARKLCISECILELFALERDSFIIIKIIANED